MKQVNIHTICFSVKDSKTILECTVHLLYKDESPRVYSYYNLAEGSIKTNRTKSIPKGLDFKTCNN